MAPIDTTKFKALIEVRLNELREEDELGKGAQQIVELDQQSVGRLSRMDAMQSQAMAQAQQRRRHAIKIALQSALKRIHDREFGFCKDCGDEIDQPRLIANPMITKCITCLMGE